MRSNWFRKAIFILIGLFVVIAALVTRRQPVVWLFFLDECGWYLVVAVFIHAPVFVAGSFVLALLPRQHPGVLGWRLLRLGLFVWVFLFVSAFSTAYGVAWSGIVFITAPITWSTFSRSGRLPKT